ncbi:DUF1054 domain-containing protein [Evansella cellulosilytica]|uniref:UPF0637 protein Bcell_2656 n=1 Tax=Evansella cellulosilytica (strain ATCC 21833 / DSM 2522 / FERM P-1141 / JCM 9156 / N-4) TaxID=649639 RepID=E6TUM1_EVAC2|nr:DUF1054 domain-containing protein [Evansella cellulosilytica]ADU30911.1 protein of unknown function DUF1054 [Evansella cellulosilytica DSM 2522]
MSFTGFSQKDFDTFQIDGLDERMSAIQERIQPKFKAISEEIINDLSDMVGHEMFLHVAKHARRKVNPPKDTWSAYCHNKRGYKKHPHFQIGVFDDHMFIWLAYIYELPNKAEIATALLDNIDSIIENIPNDYVLSLDHMEKKAESLQTIDLTGALERFRDVKKGEFLIGRHISANDPLLQDGDKLIAYIRDTFQTLTPIYKISMR